MRYNNSLDTHAEVLNPSAQQLHMYVIDIFECYMDIRVWEFDESLAPIVDVPVNIYRAATDLVCRVDGALEYASEHADDNARGAFMHIMHELLGMKDKAESIVNTFYRQQENKPVEYPESYIELRYLNGR